MNGQDGREAVNFVAVDGVAAAVSNWL